MLVSYNDKKKILVSLIIILIDGIIVYCIPSYYHAINYFYPMLTISLIPFLYDSNLNNYYKIVFILGFIYDLLYSNIFLFNAMLFLLLSKIDTKILKLLRDNLFTNIVLVIINILLYDLMCFFLTFITDYQNILISDYIYKIEHSLLINVLVGLIYYLIIKNNK